MIAYEIDSLPNYLPPHCAGCVKARGQKPKQIHRTEAPPAVLALEKLPY